MSYRSLSIALLLGTVCCADAFGWDSNVAVSVSLPVDFAPAAMTPPDTNGYWALQSGAAPAVVRFDTNGTPQIVRYPPYKAAPTDVSLVATGDGGVAVLAAENGCTLHRYDKTGKLLWTNVIQTMPDCTQTVGDGAGNLWQYDKTILHKLGADGGYLNPATIYPDGVAIGWPFGAGALLIGPAATTGDRNAQARLITPTGSGFAYSVYNPAGTSFTHVAAVNAGSFFTVGLAADPPGNPTSYSLFVGAAFSPDLSPGGFRSSWTYGFGDILADAVTSAVPAAPYDLYVSVSQPGTVTSPPGALLVSISQFGRISWTRPIDGTVRSGADGDAVVVGKTVTRFDNSGKQRFSHPLPANTSTVDHQVLADGSSLAILRAGAVNDGSTPATQFLHTGATGATLASPKTTGIVQSDRVLATTFAADDSWFILATNQSGDRFTLLHTRADGTPLWQSAGIGQWLATTQLVVIGDSICAAGALDHNEVVACRNAANGQATATATLAQVSATTAAGTRASAIGNDRIVLAYHDGSQWHHALVDLLGNVLHDARPFDANMKPQDASFDAAGDAFVVAGAGYAKISPTGAWMYKQSTDATKVGSVERGYLAADGSGVFFASRTNAWATMSRIDASGNILWTYLPPFFLAPGDTPATAVVFGDDAVYFATDAQFSPVPIYKFALADGNVQWGAKGDVATGGIDRLIVDRAHHRLLSVAARLNKVHSQLLDETTGIVLDIRDDACGADLCTFADAAVAADNSLHVVASTRSSAIGGQIRAYSRTDAWATQAAVRADQAGLRGAWYAPYSAGQGLVLDYLPGTKTLFVPWFTFARPGDALNGTAEPGLLNWYTLQGNVLFSGDTTAGLGIYRTDPGAFNAGTVATHLVGTASMQFSDCNNGSLRYAFYDGTSGVISLVRLSPATVGCVLADGSTAPPAFSNPPQNGFDARQSGSWYDPATSGQGVEMTVLPAGNGSPGLLFAAWFTFDIDGRPDDSSHQHWFTVQGNLSGASNGLVTLPIFETLGGLFDGDPTGNILPVGYANIVMSGCDTALFVYQFDKSDIARAYSGLRGQMNLKKALGCSSP